MNNKSQKISHNVRSSFSSSRYPGGNSDIVELHYDATNPEKCWYTEWTQSGTLFFSGISGDLGVLVLIISQFAKPASKEK